jgi:hypothetical protein
MADEQRTADPEREEIEDLEITDEDATAVQGGKKQPPIVDKDNTII